MEEKNSKVLENKRFKRNAIFEAAYNLFTTKGINNTTISDIVNNAGVAKGTFYLYFNDKYDILDLIILKKSTEVIVEASKAAHSEEHSNFEDRVIYFTNFIIEYLKKNKILLKIIHKDLSYGMFTKALKDQHNYLEISNIVDEFINGLVSKGYDIEDAKKVLFIIVDMIGSVCYSAIVLEQPFKMDEMKPILFKIIKSTIDQNP
ncbi:MAG: TetR/AcrR family transcriptional regulator [Clostridia bacterium]|nr:TetR/AcrR family transcriptional regulator [Clostridia bacterium]